ncbi:FKBP-type peptidyl-prolyl cis-trans isomerase [Geomonas paludis]|uniref:Peptidyl-prolyl cis-trans isomerase n=1 Tax=Geomonas paludis TaxID=2740185 RepID=A0A6V8N1L5_9BACT|nr:FKBP-type peptidyl-prolyl cis-trans isomerase [Geomonas paludis]UPU34072.1 FKBP-type peptidyl-prolyl cis-trans isomerase [Geomonas paludis]GFO65653.1 outer membrane protein MIP [Geomonas paludis]
MRSFLILLAVMLAAAPARAAEGLSTQKERINYAIGVNLIGNLKQQEVDIDLELVVKGMRDALAGGPLLMSDEDLRKYISFYQHDVRRKVAKTRAGAAQENERAGAQFMSANKNKKGVVSLPSGLQYRVLREGAGKRPVDADNVTFHYRSSSITGTEYESSYRTGHPASRRVGDGVVPGLSEALKLMPVGSKWQLFLPPKLAYDNKGNGTKVGPNETIVFEIDLLAIN